MSRLMTVAVMAIATACLPACESTTGQDDSTIDLRGVWSYNATQSGSATLLEGTVIIDDQDGASFSGQFNGQVRDPDGVITDLDGVVSGRAFGDDAVDFDLFASTVERRHVGHIASADSIGGTWAQQNSAASFSGAFSLKRQ